VNGKDSENESAPERMGYNDQFQVSFPEIKSSPEGPCHPCSHNEYKIE
jgi:hypothetical protein